ncbi:ABC transporter ATP-binding protein [Bradyrhizobium sp. NP1]|uniref:ABC transporter ATP-binding protein n=1 Tax=Bradyrhizobium sp. NP1 TaxID=3049772 RepID=UPI0025A59E70|nr:ABC transporter ATP-binding protein [Bradyrhizobium sp. NP1]WJR76839.1 ABC transporter ATP-binding protein [Bradyrhizobium sp. NP1]
MIKIENLSASYGRIQALRAVTLNMSPGTVFAVLGANGAGKTTLLRSILGLVSTTGTVRLDGQDISRLATHERIRRGIAIVPEGRRLFSDLTVRENLLIGAINRSDRSRVQSELQDICDAFPILGKRRDQAAKSLSGGEGQLLALGRAMLSRPKVLLLDEPSVGLMPIAVTEVFTTVAKVSREKGLTILLVEQNAKKALKIADEAAVLELGSVAFKDSARGMREDRRVQEAYLGGH